MALSFDGATSFVTYSDNALMDGVTKLTVDFDVFFNTLTIGDLILHKYVAGATGWRLETVTAASTFGFRFGLAVDSVVTQTSQFVVNTWQHWTITYDGAQATNAAKIQAYLDGSPRTLAFSAAAPASILANAQAFRVGHNSAATLDGKVANLKIWNDWVSADEALLMLRYWRPHKTTNLLLWSPFDDATLAKDYSGHAEDGTVTACTQVQGPQREMGFSPTMVA